jgi:two-component system sensor histidine kinase KdpD
MSRALSGALAEEQVVEIADRWIEQSFHARAVVMLPDEHDKLERAESRGALPPAVDHAIAQWVFDHAEPAGIGTDTLPASPLLYLPLKAPMRTRGVLAVEPASARVLLIPEQRRQLDTFAALIAIALERVHFVTIARGATVQIEGERLRNSLLSALSHDLRTPLTALLGAAESLRLDAQSLTREQLDRVDAIREQARRTSALVENILDMARLESGEVRLRREWQSLEEIVGSALEARATVLEGREVSVALPPDLPLVECDATLIERVLVNLLENAAKYTPAASRIEISARVAGTEVRVDIADNGKGVAAGMEAAIFEKFARGSSESAIPGLGLGLAICRTIVAAHGGRIWVERHAGGGADFAFTLPRGNPPEIEAEDAP